MLREEMGTQNSGHWRRGRWEGLVVHEVIVIFKGSIIFKQYIPKKHKW